MNSVGFLPAVALAVSIALPYTGAAAELGMPAPPLKIGEWVKGSPVDLKEGKGEKIYVVEFWATWCPPCRASIPHLSELQEKFKGKGIVIIGISDEALGTVKPFVQRMGEKMDYTVAVDQDDQTGDAYMKAFGVRGIPHAFVVNKEGVIAWHGHPMAGLEQTLEQIIAGKFDIEAAKKAAKAEELLQEYAVLAIRSGKSPQLKEIGERILDDAGENASMLNEFAWFILTDRRLSDRDLDLALRAAKAANSASNGEDPAILDTYARALFDTGKVNDAIRFQQKAIEKCKDQEMREQLKEVLDRYLKEAGAEEI